MHDVLSWVATIATIVGALLTASNLGAKVTGSGFVVFLFGSICWVVFAMLSGQQALLWTNIVLTFLNLFGIWRWLGRQAAVERGAKGAAEASKQAPSDTLFPASLFTTGRLLDRSGGELAQCVDAMLDERGGNPVYLVVSEGGLAGAGETLRRIPWDEVRASARGFTAMSAAKALSQYEAIDRSQWPAR